jgi:hypothetical protein
MVFLLDTGYGLTIHMIYSIETFAAEMGER